MKRNLLIVIIIFFSFSTWLTLEGQNCKKFHLYGKCMQYPGANYKIEGQSRSNIIGVGDKLIYNVVLYGGRNYKLFFCTSDMFYPVHFVLKDNLTKGLIYDSSNEDFPETVEIDIESTRRILIEIAVLANSTENKVADNLLGCLGFLMYWKPDVK